MTNQQKCGKVKLLTNQHYTERVIIVIQRFEDFVSAVSAVYKGLNKIKNYETEKFGLRGSHVMCMFYLARHKEGLTLTEICEKTGDDKAAVSRILSFLQENDYIILEENESKKYKRPYLLTEKGKEVASQLDEIIVSAVDRIGTGLTIDEREGFYLSFGKIAKNLDMFCKELEEER